MVAKIALALVHRANKWEPVFTKAGAITKILFSARDFQGQDEAPDLAWVLATYASPAPEPSSSSRGLRLTASFARQPRLWRTGSNAVVGGKIVAAEYQGRHKALKDSNFIVVGMARNCAGHLESDIARLALALVGARSVRWLVIESDSTDATGAKLQQIAQSRPGFHFKSLGRLADRMPSRPIRIAHCRNAALAEIRTNPAFADADYVIMADLDGVNLLINADAIASCWRSHVWDMVAANQLAPYYDVWALRHPLWSPNDCWQQYRYFTERGMAQQAALFACVYSRMLMVSPQSSWIEVESAFGGLAIYRRAVIETGQYAGMHADGAECCEHVPFHRTLRANGARLFINPALINADWNEHSQPLRQHT